MNTTELQLWDASQYSELNPKESNNRSTVLSLRFNQVGLLLTGDLEEPIEQALVKYGMVTQYTIIKVRHHGSKSSTSESFLRAVRPEIAVISAGKNNTYGHPSTHILQRLTKFGVKQILRTDQQGTIELLTDGQAVWYIPNLQQKTIQQLGWLGRQFG